MLAGGPGERGCIFTFSATEIQIIPKLADKVSRAQDLAQIRRQKLAALFQVLLGFEVYPLESR
jgi:hypothetical protein